MVRLSLSQLTKMFGKDRCHELGVRGRQKYGNRKCSWRGIDFPSEHERDRYIVLWYDQRDGKIRNLRTQVRYELIPKKTENGKLIERACAYIADFVYQDQQGNTIVEDAKSEATRKNPTYIIKRKLMYEKYGIRIREV